jgi:hypothetical protein
MQYYVGLPYSWIPSSWLFGLRERWKREAKLVGKKTPEMSDSNGGWKHT